jgi:hypothetical protein
VYLHEVAIAYCGDSEGQEAVESLLRAKNLQNKTLKAS